MGEKIDKFTNDLNARLTSLDDRLRAIKSNIEATDAKNKAALRAKLDEAQEKLTEKKREAEASRAEMMVALEQKHAETKDKIDEWKHNREVHKLEKRADNAEEYAVRAIVYAAYTIEEADYATLAALEARLEAEEIAGRL